MSKQPEPSSVPSAAAVDLRRLVSLPGQPVCKHYSGATLSNLTGDYTCQCLAGVPYKLFPSDMGRWPCRRRHILGLEQAECSVKDYGSEISGDVDAQVDEMVKRALIQPEPSRTTECAPRRSVQPDCSAAANCFTRDWHWTLRSMEIYAGPLCRRCGESIPSTDGLCEECEVERLYD